MQVPLCADLPELLGSSACSRLSCSNRTLPYKHREEDERDCQIEGHSFLNNIAIIFFFVSVCKTANRSAGESVCVCVCVHKTFFPHQSPQQRDLMASRRIKDGERRVKFIDWIEFL